MSLAPSMICLAGLLAVISCPVTAQTKTATDRSELRPGAGGVQPLQAPEAVFRPGTIAFDGEAMTDARAEALSDGEGLDYVGFAECVEMSWPCVAIGATNKRGVLLWHYLQEDRCAWAPDAVLGGAEVGRSTADEIVAGGAVERSADVATERSAAAGSLRQAENPVGRRQQRRDGGERAGARRNARVGGGEAVAGRSQPLEQHRAARRADGEARRMRQTAPRSLPQAAGTVAPPTGQLPREEDLGRQADTCFGPYRVVFRIRHEGALHLTADEMASTEEQRIQLIGESGRWSKVATLVSSAWSYGSGLSSGLDQGWAWEIRDADDKVVAGESETSFAIASSSPTGDASTAELCEAKADFVAAKMNATAAKVRMGCKFAPLPDTIAGTGKFEPGGVGVDVSLGKTNDVCVEGENVARANSDRVKAEINLDCLQNPGRYFPNLYPPVNDPFDAQSVVPGYDSFVGDGPQTVLACSPTVIVKEEVDMGDGVVCSADVSYVCDTTTEGTCECHSPSVIEHSMVCVDESPPQ